MPYRRCHAHPWCRSHVRHPTPQRECAARNFIRKLDWAIPALFGDWMGDALPKPNNASHCCARASLRCPRLEIRTAWSTFGQHGGCGAGRVTASALVVAAVCCAAALKTVAFKGWIGEGWCAICSKNVSMHPVRSRCNVTVQDERGSTQIDSILISQYGIFVLEVKNYSGWITGRVADSHWRQTHYRRQYEFQNPLRQTTAIPRHWSAYWACPARCFIRSLCLPGTAS